MTIETELQTLVLVYANYDEKEKCYSSKLNQGSLLRLDSDFTRLINRLLLKDGPDKKRIEKNYRKLALYFHPDHKETLGPEVKWLEQNLSEGQDDAICVKTLHVCYDKLISPHSFKQIKFDEITTRDDLKKWLNTLKENSRTYTERSFYASLLGLLNESTAYFDEVGRIKQKGLRALVAFLPVVFISFGTFILAEELFAAYTLYFVLLRGGQYLGSSDSKELRKLGQTLQKISVVTAAATTTLLARLLEMTFWASRQCYNVSLQIGSALLIPLITTSKSTSQNKTTDDVSLCRDLILASQNMSGNNSFNTPQLKLIAAPIESHLGLLEQQFFKNWRAGGGKYRALEALLLRMRVADKDDELTVEEKIDKAHTALELIKKNPDIYTKGGKTAFAVDQAERVIYLLKENFADSQCLLLPLN